LLDNADATALLGDDGAPDPEKLKAAVTELLELTRFCRHGMARRQRG
jgi:hypothetical protein